MLVNRNSENLLTHALLSFLFFHHGFILILFTLVYFFGFCFMGNKYYSSKLIPLTFCRQKISFLCKHIYFFNEKHTQWNLDTKVKAIHKSVSMFHEMPLKSYFMKFSARKVSQCILTLKQVYFLLIISITRTFHISN